MCNDNEANKVALSNSVYVRVHHNSMIHAHDANKVNFATRDKFISTGNVLMHFGSLESTQEARVALGGALSNSYAAS